MSLLLKALENAAKNREAGGPASDPGAAPDAAEPASELALEPLPQSSTRAPSGSARSASQPGAAAQGATGDEGRSASQHQAQSVLRAGAPRPSRPGAFEWIAQRPLVAFSTAAGLFAIGYGTYLYLQLTNPGIFTPRPAPVAKPPIAAAPPPIQAPAPPPLAVAPDAATPAPGVLPSPAFTPSGIETPPAAGSSAADSPAAGTGVAPSSGGSASAPGVAAAPSPAPGRPAAQPLAPGPAGQVAVAPPPASAVAPAKPEAAVAPKPEAPAPARARAPRAAPARPAPPPADGIAQSPAGQVVPVSVTLSSAHQALEMGRFDEAERLYRQTLANEPRSVDAMLGLAGALVGQSRADAATQYYLRVLEQDPRNAHAQAGLLGIGGRADPAAAEARLKQLIAREPSGFLYFSLGNLYAEHGRWAPAQAAYFQALNLAPDNPDYAFNLAVGLEHLSQPKIALNYYRRAAALAQARGHAQFDGAALQSRIRNLETALAETP